MRSALAAIVTAVALLYSVAPAPAIELGFNDEVLSQYGTEGGLAEAFPRATSAGAAWWRVALYWNQIAPNKPPNAAAASDPGWPGYDWTKIDRVIRSAAASDLKVLPYPLTAPAWAEGPNRPRTSTLAPAGTWRPSPLALRELATALAKRYSGTFPDPLLPGMTLPKVTWFQAWNEPNLSTYLTPQWSRVGGRWTVQSASHYRRLANAFYDGIKRGNSSARVVSAGTAPFGDLNDGDPRVPPVRFWRELLCIRNPAPEASRTSGRIVTRKCGTSVKFDAVAHHPYPIGPPRRTARNADDVVVPDLRKISRLLPTAVKAGTLKPDSAKPLWVTEYAWESSPDPDGLSLAEQAQYLQASFYVLAQQRVKVAIWWQMRDAAGTPATWAETFQSGIFLRGASPAQDTPKPAYTAFRFPFTAYRTNGVARLWGKTPGDRNVTIQAQQGGRWVTAARLNAGSNRIFTGRLRVGPNTPLRAVAGTDISLTWRTQ